MSGSNTPPAAPARKAIGPLRMALVLGAALVLLGSAATAVLAHGGGFPGVGGIDGREGAGSVIGPITIKAINGSSLSLESADGWTRTITVTSSTAITKGDKAITAGDLKVGDNVRLRQTENADGTFTVTAVHVVLPRVAGTVTAKSGSSLTLLQADGTNVTVNVSSSTTYQVRGVTNAGLDDVTVGMMVVAAGSQRSDGSLDAQVVAAGGRGIGRWFGRGFGGWDTLPGASPAPSASTSSTS
jgi:hypothetical protein